MKKPLRFACLFLLALTLCACGSNNNKGNNKNCGETCRIGAKKKAAEYPIPTAEAVFPE